MPSHTIKVTGVPDELVKLLDERVKRRRAAGRSEYIRELIRKDVVGEAAPTARRSFRELLAPIHTETKRLGVTEEEVDRLVESERRAMKKASALRDE